MTTEHKSTTSQAERKGNTVAADDMSAAIARWYSARQRVFSAATRSSYSDASADLWECEQELIAIGFVLTLPPHAATEE